MSWNFPLQFVLYRLYIVTLHVSVWVEIFCQWCFPCSYKSRSTWACELKLSVYVFGSTVSLSRSTWACELKFPLPVPLCLSFQVTLHVSVWVEIYHNFIWFVNICVTLHVSVWVEISKVCLDHMEELSRSTWACELKFGLALQTIQASRHAPRERVSWNCPLVSFQLSFSSHAPRERVSWNDLWRRAMQDESSHAPRERVSWNLYLTNS